MTTHNATQHPDPRAEVVRQAKARLLAFATQVDASPPPTGATFWRMGLAAAASIFAGGVLSRLLPRIGRPRVPARHSPRWEWGGRRDIALGAILLRATQLFAPMIAGLIGRAVRSTPRSPSSGPNEKPPAVREG